MSLVRAAHFAAVLLPPGLLAFQGLIARPARNAGGTAIFAATEWRLLALAFGSAVLALFTGLAWFALVAMAMSGEALTARIAATVLTNTHFGKVWLVHLVLTLLLCGFLTFLLRRKVRPHLLLAWVFAGSTLISTAFVGHAWASIHPLAGVAIDALHLVASSFWPAGLIPMAIYLASLPGHPKAAVLVSEMTQRFSRMSLVAVPLLALTGLINTWLITGKFLHFETFYGRLLLAKILIFTVMVGIGAANFLIIIPRLRSCSSGPPASAPRLFFSVSLEATLGCAVLFLTGLLGQAPPG